MIKRFTLLILLLQSCAVVDYKDVPALARSILFGAPDQEVTDSFYENMPYSFAKIRIGRSRIGFMHFHKTKPRRSTSFNILSIDTFLDTCIF